MNGTAREIVIAFVGLIAGILLMCGISHAVYSETEQEQAYHSRDWDGDDSRRLAQLAMYMAHDKNIEAKMTIINIAINRVWDDDYPDTIEGVVSEMTDGLYINEEPDIESFDAEHHVQIDGWDLSDGATEFEIVDNEIIPK